MAGILLGFLFLFLSMSALRREQAVALREHTSAVELLRKDIEEHRREQQTRHYDTLQIIRLEATDTRTQFTQWCPRDSGAPR